MTEARRLDPTQRAAAAADAPVQLTLAGPGAGKTTTLAVRFVHLVRQGVDPRRILAVTFTRKAAIEMQDRIVRLLRLDGPKGLAVDTFHAFAFRHLRRQPQRFGLPEQFDLWDVLQQRHVFHARRMWWNEEIDIIDLIGGMKERLIDAAGFARMVGDKSDELRAYYPAAVEFFNVYEAALRDAGAIDFADMVPLVTRAMAHDTACRSAITGAFDHMLVDEYQDVNPGQLDLIAHFVAAGVKLWAVGDDDQTLYAFRASDIRTILDFGRHHPGARIHTLEVNYRAGAAIVDAAKALIRHNRTRVDKDYRPVLTEPGEIVIRGYSSPEIEARQVAAAIAELLGQGEAPGQITILYRAGAIGLNFQTALKERQIPFEVRGSGDLWQSVGARLVVGALHYLHGGATVAAMSRLGTGQRSRIIVEHLDQIRPTVGHDFTLSWRTLCWRELDSNLRFRARAGSILPVRFVADSLLERTGFELLVSSARDGFRWVSLQFAVASRLSQQGLSCRQLQDQRRVIRNPGNPLLMGIVDAARASSQLL
jgi:DNA helicase-2/ATP-dependent DNA helicase PcrA